MQTILGLVLLLILILVFSRYLLTLVPLIIIAKIYFRKSDEYFESKYKMISNKSTPPYGDKDTFYILISVNFCLILLLEGEVFWWDSIDIYKIILFNKTSIIIVITFFCMLTILHLIRLMRYRTVRIEFVNEEKARGEHENRMKELHMKLAQNDLIEFIEKSTIKLKEAEPEEQFESEYEYSEDYMQENDEYLSYREKEISKLTKYLNYKGVLITKTETDNIVDWIDKINFQNEFKVNFYKAFDNDKLKTMEQYLQVFVEYFAEDNELYIDLFMELLKKNGYDILKPKLIQLVESKINDIEIQSYEKSLLSVSEDDLIVDDMDGVEFEKYVKNYYEKLGYSVSLTKKTGDYGADLIIEKHATRGVVQVKRSINNIGVKAIQEITSAIKYYKADYGVVATNSYFTRPAKDLASKNKIELLDRDLLLNK